MQRRTFLKNLGAAGAGLALSRLFRQFPDLLAGPGAGGGGNSARLPRRPYGESGIDLSIVGFGGIVVMNAEPDHAAKVVAEAVEKGVNYFDVAPTYGDAEQKLGRALAPYRKDVFLACKTAERKRDKAEEELKASLKRLGTDYFDLYQLHALTDVKKDVDAAFAEGGVMELLAEARKAGTIRHVGFSAHSVEAATTAMDRYDFDSILFPINFACFYGGDFGPRVIELARKKNVARLALKALARQPWPKGPEGKKHPERKKYGKCWYRPLSDPDEAALGLAFTLSQPVTSAIPPGEEELWRLAVDLAMRLKPLTDEQLAKVRAWAEQTPPIFRHERRDKETGQA